MVLDATTDPQNAEQRAMKFAQGMAREFDDAAVRLRSVMLTIVVVVSLSLVIIARVFSRRLMAPLDKLASKMKLWDGQSHIGVFVEGESEVALLARQFSNVTDKVARLQSLSQERQRALGETEDELKRLTTTLEDQIEKRTLRLSRALEKLQSLDRAKDEFLSLITHELKTPLTSITACSEALAGQVQLPVETQKKFLSIIQDESMRLTRLINEVLDYSRIAVGEFPILRRRINLVRQLERAILISRPAAEQKLISLLFKEPSVEYSALQDVPADPDRIQQVMANLLGNAIKFTPEKGTIIVSVDILRKSILGRFCEFARVRIEDNGIGIEPGMRSKVFERFGQAGKLEHHSEGTGLGMPIARGILKGHGGRLWFTSRPNEGTTFYFTLPMDRNFPKAGDDANDPAVEK
jgi:hypothetical protein